MLSTVKRRFIEPRLVAGEFVKEPDFSYVGVKDCCLCISEFCGVRLGVCSPAGCTFRGIGRSFRGSCNGVACAFRITSSNLSASVLSTLDARLFCSPGASLVGWGVVGLAPFVCLSPISSLDEIKLECEVRGDLVLPGGGCGLTTEGGLTGVCFFFFTKFFYRVNKTVVVKELLYYKRTLSVSGNCFLDFIMYNSFSQGIRP